MEYLAGALRPELEFRGFGAPPPSLSKRAAAALGITPETLLSDNPPHRKKGPVQKKGEKW